MPFQPDKPNYQTMATAQVKDQSLNIRGSFDKVDNDLTSIQWLLNFTSSRTREVQEAPASNARGLGSQGRSKTETLVYNQCRDDNYYKKNTYVKPPFSCTNLILLALEASGEDKITLSSIYKWVMDTFPYYSKSDTSWQNSIRHSLSLNTCFMKVPRMKNERRKGGYWKIDPLYSGRVLRRAYKSRKNVPVPFVPEAKKVTTRTSVHPTYGSLHQHQGWNSWVSGAAGGRTPEDPGSSACAGSPLVVSEKQKGQSYGTTDLDPALVLSERHVFGLVPPEATDQKSHLPDPEAPGAGMEEEIGSALDLIWSDICHMDFLNVVGGSDNFENCFDANFTALTYM